MLIQAKTIAACLLCSLIPATGANAASSEWREVLPRVEMRLVAAPVSSAGPAVVGLEIRMPDGYQTYWRHPGEAGIAPSIDLSGSTGLARGDLLFPLPTVLDERGAIANVYLGHTVLPIEIEVDGAEPVLVLQAQLGICAEVCMPVSERFELALDGVDDPDVAARIDAAAADVPVDWTFPDPAISGLRLTKDGLAFDQLYGGIDPSSYVVSVDGAEISFRPSVSTGDAIAVSLADPTEMLSLPGKHIQVAFRTDMGAFSVRLEIPKG